MTLVHLLLVIAITVLLVVLLKPLLSWAVLAVVLVAAGYVFWRLS